MVSVVVAAAAAAVDPSAQIIANNQSLLKRLQQKDEPDYIKELCLGSAVDLQYCTASPRPTGRPHFVSVSGRRRVAYALGSCAPHRHRQRHTQTEAEIQ